MNVIKKILLIAVTPICFATSVNAQNNKTYKFEPSVSIISGIIEDETFFDANDKKVNCFVLKLDSSIRVVADNDDELNSTTNNVTKVQLTSSSGINFSNFKNKRVRCTGTFFSSHTAHHHTKVLMSVKKIQEIK